jgi:hypothetical protein
MLRDYSPAPNSADAHARLGASNGLVRYSRPLRKRSAAAIGNSPAIIPAPAIPSPCCHQRSPWRAPWASHGSSARLLHSISQVLTPETCHVVGFCFLRNGGTKYSRRVEPLHLGARYGNYDAEVLVHHDRHAFPVGPRPCFGHTGPNILFIRTVTTGHGLARVLLAGRPRSL